MSSPSSRHVRGGVIVLALAALGGTWLVQFLHSRPRVFHDHAEVWSLAFSPDGRTLATGHQLIVEDRRVGWAYGAGDIQFRDVATGRITSTFPVFYPASRREDDTKSVPACWLAFSPDGRFLMVSNMNGGGGNTVGVLNIATRQWTVALHPSYSGPHERMYCPVGFSPDSGRAYYLIIVKGAPSPRTAHFEEDLEGAQHEAVLVACDPSTGRLLSRMPHLLQRGEWPAQATMLTDGSAVALAIQYGTNLSYMPGGDKIALVSTATGMRLREIKVKGEMQPSLVSASRTSLLAYSGQNDTVMLWDGHSDAQTQSVQDISQPIALSPDGTLLAYHTHSDSVVIWDIQRARMRRNLGKAAHWIRNLTFSPDGHTLAASDGQKTIMMWHI